jgi:SOS-response transcriptional repressor LexA
VKNISERLSFVISAARYKQKDLAKAAGLKPQAINEVIKGRSGMSERAAMLIESNLGIPAAWLLRGEGTWSPPPPGVPLVPLPVEAHTVPIYAPLRAGCPSHGLEGDIVGRIGVSEDRARRGYFACRISGNSMRDRLNDGDIAIFRPIHNGEAIPSDKPCVICVEEWPECVVKYVERAPGGKLNLVSHNKDFKPEPVDPEIQRVHIIGVLAERRTMEE